MYDHACFYDSFFMNVSKMHVILRTIDNNDGILNENYDQILFVLGYDVILFQFNANNDSYVNRC